MRLSHASKNCVFLALVTMIQCVSEIWTSLHWFGGFILGTSQFLLLPQLPTSRVVKSDTQNNHLATFTKVQSKSLIHYVCTIYWKMMYFTSFPCSVEASLLPHFFANAFTSIVRGWTFTLSFSPPSFINQIDENNQYPFHGKKSILSMLQHFFKIL